jgi:hypothetical protein
LYAEDKQKACAPLITKGGTYTHEHALEKSGDSAYIQVISIVKKERTETQKSNARYFGDYSIFTGFWYGSQRAFIV